MEEPKVLLIGWGPNAKRNYLPYLRRNEIHLAAVIELESKRECVQDELGEAGFDAELFLLPDCFRDDEELPADYRKQFKETFAQMGLTHVIINSEPKAHYMYLELFAELPVYILLEKPLIVPKNLKTLQEADKMIHSYYNAGNKLKQGSALSCNVMCQRRANPAYSFFEEQIKEVVTKYQIPITGISLDHCDGNWMMPHDMFYENHPYQYGYGKLFHSGYHFIDFLSRLISLNRLDEDKQYESARLTASFITEQDEVNIINWNDYHRLFKDQQMPDYYKKPISDEQYTDFGDKNIAALLELKNSKGRNITLARLGISQFGFSRRAWIQTRPDHYKGNGRIRHENVNVQIGPLMNLQIHSYQSGEDTEHTVQEFNNGGQAYFDIDIYRNAGILGGKSYLHYSVADFWPEGGDYHDLNEYSRVIFLDRYFAGNPIADTSYEQQRLGMELMYRFSRSLISYRKGCSGPETFDLHKYR